MGGADWRSRSLAGLLAVVLIGSLGASSASATTPGPWTVQTTPQLQGPQGSFNRVSCPTVSWCMAVGSSLGMPLAQRWDGQSWAPTPITPPPGGGYLYDVSCTSESFCMAVGSAPVTYLWNGTSWSRVAAAGASEGLSGVSCTSPSACTAVGGQSAPYAERWNGKFWVTQRTPSTGSSLSGLNSVACPSASSCMAVGYTGNEYAVLAEHWDGRAWSIEKTPSIRTVDLLSLFDVACPATTRCVAVGFSITSSGQGLPLAESWNGTSWVITKTPNPPSEPGAYPGSQLVGLSCPSVANCLAVGNYTTPLGLPRMLVEKWNGTSWAIAPAPTITAPLAGSLEGVSCPSATVCTAVGSSVDAAGNKITAAWRTNSSSWVRQATTSPVEPLGASLSGLSCPAAAVCSAVGQAGGSVLAERWNGVQWSVDHVPNPTPGAALVAVSCPSTTACMAVGSYTTASEEHVGLSEMRAASGGWNQQVVPTPAGAVITTLTSVSCASPASCMAVGSFADSTKVDPPTSLLAESWNGQHWTIDAPPTPLKGTSATFSGVSCPTATFCEVVGEYADGSGNEAPLAERWDGSGWTVERAANPSYKYESSGFNGVTCLSATSCVAVGGTYNLTVITNSLVEVRSGTSWSIQHSANKKDDFVNALLSVSCRSAGDCTSVGQSYTSDYFESPLAEAQAATAWNLESTPNLGANAEAGLSAVACPAGGACMAVGNGPYPRPLVLRQ